MSSVSALQLRDQVAVVNGLVLPEPLTVGTVEPGKVRLIPNRESAVEWWLYEDQHDVETVADVEVVEPEPSAKPRRTVSKVVEGVRLISHGDGHWASEDNQHFVQREDGYTFCEAEHPMKLTPALVEWAQANPYKEDAGDILAAHRQGKRGYLCPGNAEHTYDIWTVMTPSGWATDTGDSFAEALSILADAIRQAR